MSIAALALTLSIGLAAETGAPIQVVVLVEAALGAGEHFAPAPRTPRWLPAPLRAELDAFERALPNATYAPVVCDLPDGDEPLTFIGSGIANALDEVLLRGGDPCSVSVDAIDRVLDRARWTEGAQRRIVLLGRGHGLLTRGRTTIESAMNRAAREGVVLSAFELVPPLDDSPFLITRSWSTSSLQSVRSDVLRFLERPLEPLGRAPTTARHAALHSGGWHRLVVDPSAVRPKRPSAQKLAAEPARRRSQWREIEDELARRTAWVTDALDRAYGPKAVAGDDALTDVVWGRRRTSEIDPSELPPALAGVNLEPLLDAAWDFVDARRVLRAYLDGQAPIEPGTLGAAWARDVASPPRRFPSRR